MNPEGLVMLPILRRTSTRFVGLPPGYKPGREGSRPSGLFMFKIAFAQQAGESVQ